MKTDDQEKLAAMHELAIRADMMTWPLTWVIDALDPTEYGPAHNHRAADELHRRLGDRN